jgi:hypothetical protein
MTSVELWTSCQLGTGRTGDADEFAGDPIRIDVGVGLGDVLETVRRSRSEADRAVRDSVEEASVHAG